MLLLSCAVSGRFERLVVPRRGRSLATGDAAASVGERSRRRQLIALAHLCRLQQPRSRRRDGGLNLFGAQRY